MEESSGKAMMLSPTRISVATRALSMIEKPTTAPSELTFSGRSGSVVIAPTLSRRTSMVQKSVNPFAQTPRAPPAPVKDLISIIRAAAIMNAPTTVESAAAKAALYDQIGLEVSEISDGDLSDEKIFSVFKMAASSATKNGTGAALSSAMSCSSKDDLSGNNRHVRSTTFNGRESISSSALANIARRRRSSAQPSSGWVEAEQDKDTLEKSGSIGFRDAVSSSARTSVAFRRQPMPKREPGKLKRFLNTVVLPSVRSGMGFETKELETGGLWSESTDIAGPMRTIRMLHNKLQVTIEEFDETMSTRVEENDRSWVESYRNGLEAVERNTRHQFEEQLKKLSRENEFIRLESERAFKQNDRWREEIQELRIFKSCSESEQRLLLEDYARVRLKCKWIYKKLKESRGKQKCYVCESCIASNGRDYIGSKRTMRPESAPEKRSNQQTPSSSKTQSRPKSSPEKRSSWTEPPCEQDGNVAGAVPRIEYTTEDGNEGWSSEFESSEEENLDDCAFENRDRTTLAAENSLHNDEGSSSSEDLSDWEQWCRELTAKERKWNSSTASKLLSGPAPPSVIHIGEGPQTANVEKPFASRPTSAIRNAHSRTATKWHEGLKDLRKKIRKEKEKRHEAPEPESLRRQLLAVLSECYKDIQGRKAYESHRSQEGASEKGPTAHGNSDVPENMTIHDRASFLSKMESQEDLVKSIIDALSACLDRPGTKHDFGPPTVALNHDTPMLRNNREGVPDISHVRNENRWYGEPLPSQQRVSTLAAGRTTSRNSMGESGSEHKRNQKDAQPQILGIGLQSGEVRSPSPIQRGFTDVKGWIRHVQGTRLAKPHALNHLSSSSQICPRLASVSSMKSLRGQPHQMLQQRKVVPSSGDIGLEITGHCPS
ncbi:hypothetical protein BJ742DRAFT_899288 [Cladochytrium replicatum]|nr:hypothetical protein BJ742DRAFT_899288 [Cladochytrium replicatum]